MARTTRLAALAALAAAAAAASPPQPASNLMVEYLSNPTAIDVTSPRFFWLPNHDDRGITQTSYRIVVNSTTAGGQTVWDSGVVASSATTHVAYAGAALQSDTVYTWAVQWTDSNGAVSPWSAPARFGTGLLTQAEWAPAAWIGCPLNTQASDPVYNQLRAEFSLDGVVAPGATIVQARAYVTAVGYYLLRVNGQWATQWAGEHARPRLDPGWTTYEVTSLYSTYDVTALLNATGPNAVGVMLGNGWPDISPVPGNSTSSAVGATGAVVTRGSAAPPKLGDNQGQLRQARLQLYVRTSDGKTTVWTTTAGGFERVDDAADSSIASATTAVAGALVMGPNAGARPGWQCGAGANGYDNIYNGNTYNASAYTTGWDAPNYGYPAGTAWTAAVLRADPGGAKPTTMKAQALPPVSVQLEVPAIGITSPGPNRFVVDFGQNLAGIVRLSLPAPVPAGVTVTMRHAEVLQHPPYGPVTGDVYTGNLRSAKATDVYTTAGTDADGGAGFEVYEPVFTYHGFRYVEVTFDPPVIQPSLDMFTALHMRTGIERTGALSFPAEGAPVLNQLNHAVTWTLGNNFMSVESDCPQRDERKGWMGDSGLSLVPSHYHYAMGSFYTAWADNIRDSQLYAGDAHPAGSVPDTVPHTFGDYPSDPAWGTAYPGVVHSTWRFLGDTRIAADHYPNLQAYIAFMQGKVTEAGGIGALYQSYGDWCPPPAQMGGGQGPKPPKSYTSGVALLVDVQRMVELATALGKPGDAATYSAYRDQLLGAFNGAWLNQTTGMYGFQNGEGLQTANAAALAIGATAVAGAKAVAAVSSVLVTDVAVTHDRHWSTGIIGMRYLHSALTAAGAGETAIDTLLTTDYPGYGWWFNNDLEPATTLLELPDGPVEGPGMNSRGHHMFASVQGWVWEELAGLAQTRTGTAGFNASDASQVGFRAPVFYPRITTHANVSFVEGEYQSIAGPFTFSWATAAAATPGNTCADHVAEQDSAQLFCPTGSSISAVTFASFGTPSGSCPSGPFAASACNAANSTAIVQGACVGHNSCTVPSDDTLFGDPCYGTVKHLTVCVACSAPPAGQPLLTVTITVPPNARATVRFPFDASTAVSGITITESGADGTATPATVFGKGAFVPGAAAGVLSGAVTTGSASAQPPVDLVPGQLTVDVVIGSGSYTFNTFA